MTNMFITFDNNISGDGRGKKGKDSHLQKQMGKDYSVGYGWVTHSNLVRIDNIKAIGDILD